MKIIFDTNVILSSFLTQGLSFRVLEICIDNHQLFISQWIFDEVLSKLKKKFKIPIDEIEHVRSFLINTFHLINPEGSIPEICRDYDDNNIIHLAQYVKAELIITGDKDLLVRKKIDKIKIINPRTFMEKFHGIH